MSINNHFRNIILDRWSQIDPSKIDQTPDEFLKLYDEKLKINPVEHEAYRLAEAEWFSIFGKNKYRGFQTFQGAKSHRNRPKTRSNRYCIRNEWDSKFNFLI